jgi:hypothetical protein
MTQVAKLDDYRKPKSARKETVSVDWVEIDLLRKAVRDAIKEIKSESRSKRDRRSYKYCSIYVGRRVTNIKFAEMNVPYYKLYEVVKRISPIVPNYLFHLDRETYSLSVYMRGEMR